MLTKKNVCKAMIIVLLFGFLWGSLFLFNTNFIVNADSDSVDINELTSNEVPATYTFTRIDDNNCSVRILNKTDATKAVIPATATIDGDSYTVTEIAVNGFMSSSKLKRVFIPSTIKKINNTAFANCPVLESISLSQVETIGSNVFMMCASLEEIIIPQTVTTVGSSIFRNNNTHVQLRAASTGSNWSASWNTGNNNQEVVYNCQVIEELVVEPLYRKTMTRSSNNEVVGYSIASGQPFSDPYYEQIGNNLILHSNIDGKPLLDVEQYAFEYNHIETFLIEYSETPLLVWNLQTGTFDIAPILFIDSEIADVYNVIVLKFSDGTQVKVIYEHAFWDIDLNRYVFLRDDVTNYIGHWFNKQEMNEEGNLNWKKVQLIEVVFQQEYTIAWSPVTYSHLCYYVNGMLSMPGNTEGFVNIFEVDADTMKVNEELYLEDIEQYGLYTYEEFTQIIQIPESVFDAFNGQYLKSCNRERVFRC